MGFDYRGCVGYIKMPEYCGYPLLWPAYVHEVGLTMFRMHYYDVTGKVHMAELYSESVILARHSPTTAQVAYDLQMKEANARYTAQQKENLRYERGGQMLFGEGGHIGGMSTQALGRIDHAMDLSLIHI